MQIDFSKIKFDEKGLVPAVVQDVRTNAVVMLAYMNGESLARTIETGYTWFWSRSRQELWNKGATSGNLQKVIDINYDCDGDSLLVKVEQTGVACHTGEYSCFHNLLWKRDNLPVPEMDGIPGVLSELYRVIQEKRENGGEKSYTKYLFTSGQDKILKKVGEEAAETIEFAGAEVNRYYDVGVAGIHRLLSRIGEIREADAVIAVAGMEGALGSVLAGLVDTPVIAVPTSVGYGASFQGLAPLLSMLNSCAEGLSAVNIDNGFGAGVLAIRMLQMALRHERQS